MSPCPHCGAQARVEPSSALRWRCAVCGGPLVPTEDGIPRTHAELPHLVRSHRVRAMALGWLAAGFVLGAIAVMGVGVALLVWLASHLAAAILGVLTAVAMVLAAASFRRSRRSKGEAQAELEQAWERVAAEVLRARAVGAGDTTAADLARIMSTDEAHAERLLGSLSAHGGARVDVRDDAELAYRVSEVTDDTESPEAAGPRLRAR